ncbi:MAG: hypothetical protein Q8O27_01265 [Enterobacteriaceae bacterium]|nr:hypothetical protein [Enterobacteriaceae bacterium]
MSTKSKCIIIIILLLLSVLYALPNINSEDNAIIISSNENNINQNFIDELKSKFELNNVKNKSILLGNDNIVILFKNTEDQFNCYEFMNSNFNKNFNITLNILPSKNHFILNKIGAYPMKLGLDLKGGVYLLIKINTKKNIKHIFKSTSTEIKNKLRENDIKFTTTNFSTYKTIALSFRSETDTNLAYKILMHHFTDLEINIGEKSKNELLININKNKKAEIKNNIINQTISILSNRINELGISDSIIQKNGKDKIIIEIPGIQDITRAKNILGKTATLNFMIVDAENAINYSINGKIPSQSKIFYDKNNRPILVKNKIILDGNSIINASTGFDSQFNKPCINIKLGGNNISLFELTTMQNIGNQMAIIYKEAHIKKIMKKGNIKIKEIVTEKIINVATIMSTLGTNFQITGLNIQESKDLALLLRSGSLPATISIIEEKIIGPTLGVKNTKDSIKSVAISFLVILVFI